MAATRVKEILPLATVLQKQQNLVFVVLTLKDQAGKLVSHNTYWMQPDHDYTALSAMKPARVKAAIVSSGRDKSQHTWTVSFTNTSATLAFFVHPRLLHPDGSGILPAFWSDNYFSLAPGETVRVKVSCPSRLVSGHPYMQMQGWNVAESRLDL